MPDSLHVDDEIERAQKALISLDAEVVDIDEEAQRLLAMAKLSREAFTRETLGTWGTEPEKLGEGTVRKFSVLVQAFNTISQAVNRLDKTRELRAKKMRKEDFQKAAIALIKSLPKYERSKVLIDLLRYHRRAQGGKNSTKLQRELEVEAEAPTPEVTSE